MQCRCLTNGKDTVTLSLGLNASCKESTKLSQADKSMPTHRACSRQCAHGMRRSCCLPMAQSFTSTSFLEEGAATSPATWCWWMRLSALYSTLPFLASALSAAACLSHFLL